MQNTPSENSRYNFSIIIPSYNRSNSLVKTMDSIISQHYDSWEVIIIDDGSSDNTKEIIQPYLLNYPIKYFYQSNSGPSSARNHGMRKATGKWLSFVDSDDPVYKNYLFSAKQAIQENPTKNYFLSQCDFYYELYNNKNTLLARKSAQKNQPENITIENMLAWNVRVAMGTGLFINNTKFKNKICWDKTISPGEDLDFVFQLASLDPDGFGFIDTPLFEYNQRYGSDGICGGASYLDWAGMFEKLLAKHGEGVLKPYKSIYQRKIQKYIKQQQLYQSNQLIPPQYKYFPEWIDKLNLKK